LVALDVLVGDKRRLVDRKLEHATGRRLLSLARRLDRSPSTILALADPDARLHRAADRGTSRST